MDQVFLEILSVVISGVGIFNFMAKYDVINTRRNFYGKQNPFKEKAHIIEEFLNRIFAFITIVGFLVLILKLIYEDMIPKRIYSDQSYWVIFIISIFVTYCCTKILISIGKKSAKKKWKPYVIGIYKDPLAIIKSENLLIKDVEKSEKIINIIEEILEIDGIAGNLNDRYMYLLEIFDRANSD